MFSSDSFFTRASRCVLLRKATPVDSTVHSLLGYESLDAIPSYEVVQREFRDLTDSSEIQMDAFEAAVTRAVYTVYRAGVVPPDATRDKYNFDAVEPPLY